VTEETGVTDTTSRPLRVLVADDHPSVRAGIRFSLEDGGFVVCAETSTAMEAVAAAVAERPDIALLDVRMPGSGIVAAAEIRELVPDVAVVMLTVSRDDGDLLDALRAGAVGYLLKDIDPDRLPHALRGVVDGEAALPRSLVLRLMAEFRTRDDSARGGNRRSTAPGADRLTAREWEILDLMRSGLSTAQMAARLVVSPVTVRTHVSSILHKLRVPDRASAVAAVGLTDAAPG
jgi:DNA-binding NarL/FixJ family response regulator